MTVKHIIPLWLSDQAVKDKSKNIGIIHFEPLFIKINTDNKLKCLIAIIVFTVQLARKHWCHFPAITECESFYKKDN